MASKRTLTMEFVVRVEVDPEVWSWTYGVAPEAVADDVQVLLPVTLLHHLSLFHSEGTVTRSTAGLLK